MDLTEATSLSEVTHHSIFYTPFGCNFFHRSVLALWQHVFTIIIRLLVTFYTFYYVFMVFKSLQ